MARTGDPGKPLGTADPSRRVHPSPSHEKHPLRNDRGLATVLLIGLLPLFIAGGAALYACHALVEDLSAPRNQCRRELALALERMSVSLQSLLALNPQAARLRMEAGLAAASLAAATAAMNPPAIAKAAARARAVRAKRLALDRAQRALLRTAQGILVAAQWRARSSLGGGPIGFLKNRSFHSSPARVAVRPDAPGPAPVYVLEEDFEGRQALVQRWKSDYAIKGPLGNFLKARGSFNGVCAVTLRKERSSWRAEIIEDRFSSKRSFSSSF